MFLVCYSLIVQCSYDSRATVVVPVGAKASASGDPAVTLGGIPVAHTRRAQIIDVYDELGLVTHLATAAAEGAHAASAGTAHAPSGCQVRLGAADVEAVIAALPSLSAEMLGAGAAAAAAPALAREELVVCLRRLLPHLPIGPQFVPKLGWAAPASANLMNDVFTREALAAVERCLDGVVSVALDAPTSV